MNVRRHFAVILLSLPVSGIAHEKEEFTRYNNYGATYEPKLRMRPGNIYNMPGFRMSMCE